MDIFSEMTAEKNSNLKLEDYKTDFEKAEYLQKILRKCATNDGPSNNEDYKTVRSYFIK